MLSMPVVGFAKCLVETTTLLHIEISIAAPSMSVFYLRISMMPTRKIAQVFSKHIEKQWLK